MTITTYKDEIYRDWNVEGPYNVYLSYGQGCGTVWYKSVPDARKAHEANDHKEPDGASIGLCHLCAYSYSNTNPLHEHLPPNLCGQWKRYWAEELSQPPDDMVENARQWAEARLPDKQMEIETMKALARSSMMKMGYRIEWSEKLDFIAHWPDDEWFELTDEYDMNLYMADGKPQATIYPVIDGNTDTQHPIPVELTLPGA